MAETKQYKKGLPIAATLAVLIGASFSFFMWNQRQAESPHYVDLACAVCHAHIENVCNSADCTSCHNTESPTYYTQLKAPELQLCTSCHEREGDLTVDNEDGTSIDVNLGLSHPWGLVPLGHSPATLPLTDGKITCQTCHDVHLSNTESHMLRLYRLQASGKPDWTPLCHDCHAGY